MMSKLWTLITALQKGKELENKETWKNDTALMNVFMIILAALAEFIPELGLTHAKESAIAYGVVTVVGVINAYTHIATSATVGISK